MLPMVLALLPPQYGSHSLVAFVLVLHYVHSVIRFGVLANAAHFKGFYLLTLFGPLSLCVDLVKLYV